jgi:hypothetical protein
MPFVSEAQRGWMYANKPEMAKRWQAHTPKGKKLPKKVKKSPQEKAAEFSAFQSVGRGLLNIGSKFGGQRWTSKLNKLRARAEAGDESAQRLLSVLGMSSMMLGAGLGTAVGRVADSPVLGGAVGAALGAAPSLVRGEKKTPVLVPGFASEKQEEEQLTPPAKVAMAKSANGDMIAYLRDTSKKQQAIDKAKAHAKFRLENGMGKAEERKQAFKYGFFIKVAELGLTPGEFAKAAIAGPLMAGGAAAGAAGRAGETAGGLGRWGLEKALGTLKWGLKTPMIVAPVAGMLLGGMYRGLTAPGYETPEDLRQIERVALYKRLTREALRKALKKQKGRLKLTGAKEKLLDVPALAE